MFLRKTLLKVWKHWKWQKHNVRYYIREYEGILLFPFPLQMGFPNEVIRTRIDRNWQFRIFFDILVLTFILQIDVSIWNRPRIEKPMILREKKELRKQISIFKKLKIFQYFCFLRCLKNLNRWWTLCCGRSHYYIWSANSKLLLPFKLWLGD